MKLINITFSEVDGGLNQLFIVKSELLTVVVSHSQSVHSLLTFSALHLLLFHIEIDSNNFIFIYIIIIIFFFLQ